MGYKVFISHSMSPWDQSFLENLYSTLNQYGIEAYVAEMDMQYGDKITDKIMRNIDTSDLILVLYTKSGSESQFVNQEIGYAVHSRKKVILMKERDVESKGLLYGIEVINYDPNNPQDAISRFVNYAIPLKQSKERMQGLIKLGLVVGAGYLLYKLFTDEDEDEDDY